MTQESMTGSRPFRPPPRPDDRSPIRQSKRGWAPPAWSCRESVWLSFY